MLDDLLKSLGPDFTQQFAGKLGVNPAQAEALLSQGLQTTLGGVKQQMASGDGLSVLTQMLDRNGDGHVMDDLLGFLGGAGSSGAGANTDQLAAGLGQKLGLDAATVQKGLAMVVPIVLGYLAKQRAQGTDPAVLADQVQQHGNTDLLGSLLGGQGGSSGGLGNLLGKILG